MVNKKSRKRQRKTKNRKQTKPSTSNLEGYEKLQTQLAAIQDKTHPIDESNPLKVYLVGYLRPLIRLARRTIIDQNAHYKLPRKERISCSKANLTNRIYGTPLPRWMEKGEEPPEVDDPHSKILYSRQLQQSILISFVKSYPWKFTYLMFLYLIVQFQMFIKVYATKRVLEIIDEQLNEHGHLVYKKPILI